MGSVVAPSVFATLQSAGAGGYGVATIYPIVQTVWRRDRRICRWRRCLGDIEKASRFDVVKEVGECLPSLVCAIPLGHHLLKRLEQAALLFAED